MEKATRIRWDEEDLTKLGYEMARLMLADPTMAHLQAIRQAQLILEEEKQRDIKAWSVAEPRVGPKLEAALTILKAQGVLPLTHSTGDGGVSAAPAATELQAPLIEQDSAPETSGVVELTLDAVAPTKSEVSVAEAPLREPVTSPAAPVKEASVKPSPSVEAAGIDPLKVEAALLIALQSPVVESALVELFTKAMSQAFSRMSSNEAAAAPSSTERQTDVRVLLAGFAPQQAKALEEALRNVFEVRVWRPTQGQQVFESLTGICSVAVIPEETSDDVDETLRARNLKVLRHEGSPSRLAERIEEALDLA